jgi:hypothetical protein
MKAALLTPLYLASSWVLTVSYQVFTNTAVKTVSVSISTMSPAAATWLAGNIQTVSFVYAFSWIFLLSSVLPSLILGRERSALVQYVVCLALTLLGLSAQSFLSVNDQIQSIFGAAVFLEKPFFAVAYLVVPFVFMISVDIRSRRRRSRGRLSGAPRTEWVIEPPLQPK